MIKKRWAVPLLACLAAGAAVFWLRPFETLSLLREVSLRLHGVSRVRVGTLAAWEKDSCQPGRPCKCVALIHGLGDSALTWDNVMVGRHGAAKPPTNTRLLAVELPGSEGSAPPVDYAVPTLAGLVGPALQTQCPRWTVVGNSLGGWVAGEIALMKPDMVDRLILVDAAGLSDPTGTLVKAARALENPTVENMKEFVSRCYKHHGPIPARAWPALIASIRSRPAAKIVGALKEEDLLDARAKDIKADTLVLWGANDGIVPLDIGRRFAALIPGAKLRLVPDCGHLPQQECPAAVSQALFGH